MARSSFSTGSAPEHRFHVGWRRRGRDLAALQATLHPGELASQKERLRVLGTYVKETLRLTTATGQPTKVRRLFHRPEIVLLLRSLESASRRRLRHRHVQEKAVPTLPAETQGVCPGR